MLDPYAVSGKASLALFNELVATASVAAPGLAGAPRDASARRRRGAAWPRWWRPWSSAPRRRPAASSATRGDRPGRSAWRRRCSPPSSVGRAAERAAADERRFCSAWSADCCDGGTGMPSCIELLVAGVPVSTPAGNLATSATPVGGTRRSGFLASGSAAAGEEAQAGQADDGGGLREAKRRRGCSFHSPHRSDGVGPDCSAQAAFFAAVRGLLGRRLLGGRLRGGAPSSPAPSSPVPPPPRSRAAAARRPSPAWPPPWRRAAAVFAGRPPGPRLELEHHLALLLVPGEAGLELAPRLVGDEASSRSVLPVASSLVICSRATGCCRMILPLLKSQVDVRARPRARRRSWCRARRRGPASSGRCRGAPAREKSTGSPDSPSRLASSPKSNSSFQLLISSSQHELELGGERPAGLGAEALERADLLVAQEGLDLGELEARPPGILLIEKPQPSRSPGLPVQA